MSDIKGISPSFCTHKILIEESLKPVIQPQRRLNPKVQDVVKDEIVRLLDSGLIYPISDSPWVSPIHVVPKKGGITIVLNNNNELISSRTVTGWHVYIDYRFFKISIAPEDQEMTTTFAYRRMPFRLCNAPATFQRCMTAIFHDMAEDFMEVFMDDFLVFDWSMPFKLMYGASDFAVRAFLGQRIDGKFKPIYYASKTLNDAQAHYTTTEKELLVVQTGCQTKTYQMLLLQGFNIDIKDKKGAENLAANHLSRHENSNIGELVEEEIEDKFLDEHLMILKAMLNDKELWYADYVNYIVGKVGLDFMGPFPDSRGNKYILVAVDYVSKWVEAYAIPTNDARVVVKFLKGLFARFGVPKALISDRGTHLCNSQLEKDLLRYRVTHRISTAYHPQNNGQTEVTNRAIKCILERSVRYNPKDLSEKLNDAVWAFRTTYKTPTGSAKNCFMELNELMELRDRAYRNTRIYKERTKKWHDSKLHGDKEFKNGEKFLLFNSRLKLHPGKLKSKWTGTFIVKTMYPYRAVEITDNDGSSFKVNVHRLKKYRDKNFNMDDNEFIELDTNLIVSKGTMRRILGFGIRCLDPCTVDIVETIICRFSWVFFLATKDETSGILKSFITGVENLIDQRVKAEAVNTACYVQNRVLVTKPHNKTPYELFLGRKPDLGFMRPFGCPVTILNTIDHLGKFDGKADEEFFVGYSINSKAFRVLNSRTRIIEENLHVQFSENTPNIA
ncbi:reverse transcriptase domain-containing protein [Tanacetum coccineum]